MFLFCNVLLNRRIKLLKLTETSLTAIRVIIKSVRLTRICKSGFMMAE